MPQLKAKFFSKATRHTLCCCCTGNAPCEIHKSEFLHDGIAFITSNLEQKPKHCVRPGRLVVNGGDLIRVEQKNKRFVVQ